MNPRNILISDFSYSLPEAKIAKFPLEKRDQSRLLVYRNGAISEDIYKNIADQLPENALLVFNNTRVIEARVLFQKETGGIIEIFALEPHSRYLDISTAMQNKGSVWWKCLIGGAGKWKKGQVLQKLVTHNDYVIKLTATIVERSPESFTIEFSWQPEFLNFAEILHQSGVMPIPPYLKRDTETSDTMRYQTIYAQSDGSVAAPTAGLHFTENIFASLKARNILPAFVTLHVGAGTFMPVKSALIGGHQMHAEFLQVDKTFIQHLIDRPGNIFAVGTTSMRTLESIYWMGQKCFKNGAIQKEALEVTQWEVYEEPAEQSIPAEQALQALLQWMDRNELMVLTIKTSIMIAPPYQSKLVCGLITNFHQSNSTLLLLVAALIGSDWKKVYEYALDNNFRFLSYGDGCLLYASNEV